MELLLGPVLKYVLPAAVALIGLFAWGKKKERVGEKRERAKWQKAAIERKEAEDDVISKARKTRLDSQRPDDPDILRDDGFRRD